MVALITILDVEDPEIVPEPDILPLIVKVFDPIDSDDVFVRLFTTNAPLSDLVPIPEILTLWYVYPGMLWLPA